ncbi:type IV pilus twitching motility protein PilT [Microcella sp.]|uniref:type IV pilus twitching motility protein PilT n=1 Tax=Microcella sp. TaxID=1913979 RepID=UPI00299F5ABC|nr:type IV pilus twitching motility protein PilT [Microcella sp.]MDX2024730.1 type IV pilus twitching motility protein PilT [Microcella sp.]
MTDSLGLGTPTGGESPTARRVWSVTGDESAGIAAAQAVPSSSTMAVPPLPSPAVPFPDLSADMTHLAPPPPVGQQPIAAPDPTAPPAGLAPVIAPPPPPVAGGALAGIHPALLAALDDVIARGASDLHVAGDAPPMVRIDGELRPASNSTVWSRAEVTAILQSIMTPHQRENFLTEWELDLAISPRGGDRFRVNIYKDREAMAGAFRLIPTEIKSLKQLGVPNVVSKFATLPRGLVLVTGPTGSGKSTTLAALIDLVNKTRADHIVTIEDPIEFVHQNQRALVNQREVGSDTHSFADALKRVLRQDPDVILIGELRDLETISTALTAAETGHLVFATLHTQSAAQTIDRIIDVFPPHQQTQVRSQLALTLQGVVCQTLLPRASGQGRIIATEIMMATSAIANLIREGKTYQIPSALQAGREAGMHTMDQHLADLVNSHMVTYDAAQSKVQEAENFNRLVHRTEAPSGAAPTPFADGFGGAR